MRKLLYIFNLYFLLYLMTKCIGCKKEFNSAMRERFNNIPDFGTGLSTSDKEIVTESPGCPGDLGDILLDDVQVRF